jgi:hypothetical protein
MQAFEGLSVTFDTGGEVLGRIEVAKRSRFGVRNAAEAAI